MKTIFIGGEPQLMNPTTLKDMWYIMTEVKMLVEDKEDIDILMPLFDHADADGKPPKPIYRKILKQNHTIQGVVGSLYSRTRITRLTIVFTLICFC